MSVDVDPPVDWEQLRERREWEEATLRGYQHSMHWSPHWPPPVNERHP